jgi:hypothetical protein
VKLLTDATGPGYVLNAASKLVRGDSYKRAFSRRYADRWQGKSSLLIRRNFSLVRAIYSLRGESVKTMLGLPSAISDDDPDVCSSVVLGRMHDLWVNHSPPDRWGTTEKFFGEFNSSVRSSGANRQFPLDSIRRRSRSLKHPDRYRHNHRSTRDRSTSQVPHSPRHRDRGIQPRPGINVHPR